MDTVIETAFNNLENSITALTERTVNALAANKSRFYFDGRVGVIEIPVEKVKERSSGNTLLELKRHRWVRTEDVYKTREQAEASPIGLFIQRGTPTVLPFPSRQQMPNNGIVRDKVNGTITRFEYVKYDCVPTKRYCMVDQGDMPVMSYDTVVKYYELVK